MRRNSFRTTGSRITMILAVLMFTTGSCKQTYTPKPAGYLRIDFPEKS